MKKLLTLTVLLIPGTIFGQPSLTFYNQAPMPPTNNDPNAVPQEKIIIAEDGNPVGFLNYCSYRTAPEIAGIYSLYVEPAQRGKGYAKKLLLHALSYLEQRGYKKILVAPGPFEYQDGKLIEINDIALQQKLIKLYKNVGFVPDATIPENLVYEPKRGERSWPTFYLLIAGGLVLVITAWYVWQRNKKHL